jgi:hypothetical protein
MGMSETIMAAMIGALATVFTAMFQLVLSWRSATKEERKASGGLRSFLWMLTLMGAAAAGGFAYAEYRALGARGEAAVLREEMQRELQALSASTARLEKLSAGGLGGSDHAAVDQRQRGREGVAAIVTLPACKEAQVGLATERPGCTEQDAMQVAVCVPVPASASVTAVELFARPEDSQQPWGEVRAAAGQDLGGGRFASSHLERTDADGTKQVCQTFAQWGSEKGRAVRILVRYSVS